MLSNAVQYQRMQQQHQRQNNQLDRFAYLQQNKPTIQQRPNLGNELLTKLEQAGKVPSREKFRRMCCQTFLSTGGCPYNDRCVFLHDPRLQIESFRLRTVKNVRQSGILKDTFYWPDMERSDVSLLLDAQGLPDAKQAYTIPKDFSQVPPASHHDRAVFSMWAHFIDVCVENNYPPSSNKSAPYVMSGASVNRQGNPSMRPCNYVNTLSSHALQSPTMGKFAHQSSPQSIAANLASPQAPPGNFSTPGTPGRNLACDLMSIAEIRAQYGNFKGENGIGDYPTNQGISLWEQGQASDMDKYRNKHLRGVWRLPTFITLAEGKDKEYASPTQTRCDKGESNRTVSAWTSPLQRPAATFTKPQSSLPPLASHSQHNRDSQIGEQQNNHYPQNRQQEHFRQLQQQHGDCDSRPLYSDALRAAAQPSVMGRSAHRDSPAYQRHRSSLHSGSLDSESSQQFPTIMQHSGYFHGDAEYLRGDPHSLGRASQDQHYESFAQTGDREMIANRFQRFSNTFETSTSAEFPRDMPDQQQQQRRQPYRTAYEHSYSNSPQDFDTSVQRHPQSFAPQDAHHYFPAFNGFLSHQSREVNLFPSNIGREQYHNEETQQLQQRGHLDDQDPSYMNGQALRERPLHYKDGKSWPDYHNFEYTKLCNDSGKRVENNCTPIGPGSIKNAFSIDKRNSSLNSELTSLAQVHDQESEWDAGTPLSPFETGSTATTWESVNSAFSRAPGCSATPDECQTADSIPSLTSDLSDLDWKLFGDAIAPQQAADISSGNKGYSDKNRDDCATPVDQDEGGHNEEKDS